MTVSARRTASPISRIVSCNPGWCFLDRAGQIIDAQLDDRQRIFHLVRHARRQPADGFQFGGLDELHLGALEFFVGLQQAAVDFI